MNITDEDRVNRDLLAQAYDPDAFKEHAIEARSRVAAIQWAARRHLALEAADRLLASDVFARIVANEDPDENTPTTEITHACPPEGSSRTPCCDRTPFELPLTDRMTLDASLVDCRGANV